MGKNFVDCLRQEIVLTGAVGVIRFEKVKGGVIWKYLGVRVGSRTICFR